MAKLKNEIPDLLLVSDDDRITIGKHSYGRPKVYIWHETERLEIGSFTSFADQVTIFTGGEHHSEWVTTYPLRFLLEDPEAGLDGHPYSLGPVKIGSDVWICFGVTIISGVTIGDGAIVGARSVVTSDVPPYAIVAGNPAKVIKYRFDEYQIRGLMETRWWEWPIEKIKEALPLLCASDIDEFLEFTGYGKQLLLFEDLY